MGVFESRSEKSKSPEFSRAKRVRVAIAVGLACALSILAACNSILGFDSFSDQNDAGVFTPDGNVSPDGSANDGAARDSAIDAPVIVLPPGANPATWANWPMPDRVTGSPNPPSYTTVTLDGGAEAGAVVDNVTELTWQATTGSIPANGTFEDAKAVCDGLAPKGTWRLPTRIELVSILDHVSAEGGAPKSPTIDSDYFANTPKSPTWTSSPLLPPQEPQPFWVVDFKDGTLSDSITDTALVVRCVKGTGS